MIDELPSLTIKHRRIETPDSNAWDLTPLIFEGGTKVRGLNRKTINSLPSLALKYSQISIVKIIKDHAEALLDFGRSDKTVETAIYHLKRMFAYLDKHQFRFDCVDNIREALFEYSEYQLKRANLKKIKHQSAYESLIHIANFLNGAFESLEFDIGQTRLKRQKKSLRALGREAEKVMLSDARQLAKFCFDLTQNFDSSRLRLGIVPIIIEANNQEVNLTPGRTKTIQVDTDYRKSSAYLAFNLRVTAEVFIFLGMTVQNQAPTYSLKRSTFAYKPLSDSYEVREYKNRRRGEVLFKIPKQYKPHFEEYLSFINEFAPDSDWLFPHFNKSKGFRKRTENETIKFGRLCSRYKIPWVQPSAFRKIGENILIRLANDEKTAADYSNHAVSTLRTYYEYPSLQRCMIEIVRFWNQTDPLTYGKPKVSLFNSHCNGVPLPIDGATKELAQPDCITPTGCMGCKHYRDEESFEYVWGLHSFKFLKIIESSSHRSNEEKPSNIAINWINMKIDWFKESKKTEHQEWVKEASMRIEEGEYHPTWSRKIEKFQV